MSVKLNFNDLSKVAFETISKEGIYILEVEDIIQGVTTKGDTKYEMSHKIVNTKTKVNYDNYVLYTKNDEIIPFGTNKLRKLIEATGIVVEEITVKLLKTLMVGKRFKAEIAFSEKNFPQIKFAEIFPLSDPRPALNEQQDALASTTPTEQAKPEEKASEIKVDSIDTDDI